MDLDQRNEESSKDELRLVKSRMKIMKNWWNLMKDSKTKLRGTWKDLVRTRGKCTLDSIPVLGTMWEGGPCGIAYMDIGA